MIPISEKEGERGRRKIWRKYVIVCHVKVILAVDKDSEKRKQSQSENRRRTLK